MVGNILQLKERLCDDTLEDDLLFLSRAIERSKRPAALIGYIETTSELYDKITAQICETFSIPTKQQLSVDYTIEGTHLPTIVEEYNKQVVLDNESVTLIRLRGLEQINDHFHYRDQAVSTRAHENEFLPGITILTYFANSQNEETQRKLIGQKIVGSGFKNFYWHF